MKNNLIYDELLYTGKSNTPTHIELTSYNATDIKEAKGKNISDILPTLDNNRINWIQVYGMKNTEIIKEICEHFQIDFLNLQDILNAEHPTKIEEHDNYLLFILKLFRFNETDKNEELEQQQVTVIVGTNFVITFMEYDSPVFDGISRAIQENTLKIRTRQSDYLLTVILNSIIGNYTFIINAIDDAFDDLEEVLLNISNEDVDIAAKIQSLRRQYLQMKKSVFPLKDQYTNIRVDNVLIHRVNRPYFSDVNDHLQFVLQTIEICRETLSSLVDLYISNNDLKRNEIMKRLTIVSTIFIPITFLAGVWGMNFDFMMELNWKYGYLVAWIIMIAVGSGTYFFFKMKKWY